ncbi:hypothetical protein DSECCO2_543740 [anaerobic digester metagenome]
MNRVRYGRGPVVTEVPGPRHRFPHRRIRKPDGERGGPDGHVGGEPGSERLQNCDVAGADRGVLPRIVFDGQGDGIGPGHRIHVNGAPPGGRPAVTKGPRPRDRPSCRRIRKPDRKRNPAAGHVRGKLGRRRCGDRNVARHLPGIALEFVRDGESHGVGTCALIDMGRVLLAR